LNRKAREGLAKDAKKNSFLLILSFEPAGCFLAFAVQLCVPGGLSLRPLRL